MKANFKNRNVLLIIIMGFGLIINWFFLWHKVGIAFFIFSLLWVVCFEFIKSIHLETNKLTKFHFFILPILFFSAVFIFRVNYFVLFLSSLMYWINSFLYVFLSINPKFFSRIDDIEIFKMLGRALISFGNIFSIPQTGKKIERKLLWKLIIAILITFPMLTIVTLLLASADKIFSNFINYIKNAIIPDLTVVSFFSFILALFLTFITVSYVFGFIKYSNKKIVRVIGKSINFFDLIIPSIITYSLNLIYLAFVYIQFRYLFGGHEYAVSQGIVYSEYAIKGFGEMIVVCFINFGILYLLISKFSLSSIKSKLLLIPSYAFMLLSSLIMVFSSHSRLSLYESGYGFTIDRIIPHAFLIFILLVFVLLAFVLMFKESYKNKLLIIGTFFITNIFIAGFAIFPMEKFIVRQNLARVSEGKEFDAKYLLTNLGLEGFNEVLFQIQAGKLDKDMLEWEFTKNIMQKEYDTLEPWEFYEFEYKINGYKKINQSKWQSWNLEYESYKDSVKKLKNDKYCRMNEVRCGLI